MENSEITSKVCKTCKEKLSLECFYIDQKSRDGIQNNCKTCEKARSKKYSAEKRRKKKASDDF